MRGRPVSGPKLKPWKEMQAPHEGHAIRGDEHARTIFAAQINDGGDAEFLE